MDSRVCFPFNDNVRATNPHADAKKAFKEVIKPQLKFQNHTKPADKKKDDKKGGKKKNDKKDDKKDDEDSTGSTGDKSKDSDVMKTASVGGK
jgi:hypothetical protein